MNLKQENITDIQAKFFDSLKRWTGEAYIIMRDNPSVDFSGYIKKGISNNYAYDAQCEWSRAKYIYDLISLWSLQEQMKQCVIDALVDKDIDTWDAVHLCHLANLYLDDGYVEMKQVIYDYFYNNEDFSCNWIWVEQILDVDGIQWLIHVATHLWKMLQANSNWWEDSQIIDSFQENNPNVQVYGVLENEAKTNIHIQIYLDAVHKNSEEREKRWKTEKIEYQSITEEILAPDTIFPYHRIKDLTAQQLQEVAEQIILETDDDNIEKLLRVFTFHKFPWDPTFILKYAQTKDKWDSRIQEHAIDALKFLSSTDIRNFALENILESEFPQMYIRILQSNYEQWDAKIFTELAKEHKDEHMIEHLLSAYCDVFEIHSTKEAKEPLELMYYKSNCGLHRKHLVEILEKNKILDSKIREELLYDSNLETRQLFT